MPLPNLGYYSGLFEGMQSLSGLQHQQLQNQLLKEEIPAKRLQLAAAKQQFEDAQLEKNLLRQAFQSQEWQRTGQDEQQSLDFQSGKLFQLGQRILSVNPKLGMEFIKEAEDVKRKGFENQVSMMNARKGQMEINGEIISGISSQEDLDQALPELARNGFVIPKQYREWNPETASWLKQRSRMSKTVVDGMKLDLSEARLRQQEEEHQRKVQKDDIDAKRKDNYLQIARERLQRTGKEYKAISGKSLESALIGYKNIEEFDNLNTPDKVRFAQDVDRRAYELQKQGMTPTEAQYAAEEEARSRVKEDSYLGMKDLLESKTTTVGGPQVGDVIGGYKYKGGNPADKANWEKI